MKHLVLVIAILAGSAPVQAQQQTANCLELKKVKIADHVLHQDGYTQATLTLKVKDCEIIEDHQQTAVAFESKPGLEVTLYDIAFGRPDDGSIGASSTRVKEVTVFLKLIASQELPVGESTLRGILTYQAISGGAVAPKTLALSIPFKVAPPKPYNADKERSGFIEGLEVVGQIVVGIIALPIVLLYCPLSGEWPTC